MADPLREGDPARIGRYRLLGRLGAGGMGVVYLAENRKGGRAALKLIRHELADDASFRSRFRREVQASFRVSGMCTARLIDFDTEADQPWMATEYVEGPPLDSLVDTRGPLGPDQQIALAVGLAEALVAIHEEDVVHRDLKPANVLCPESGPKIIDFGIATAADAVPLTRHGMVIGSPGWITPEQLLTGEATPASDVFAWGCLTAFAASGQQPYGSGRVETVFWRVINQPPFVDRQRLIPPLQELVDAATARDPEQRPTSTGLLERLLEVGHRHERGRRASTASGSPVDLTEAAPAEHAAEEASPAGASPADGDGSGGHPGGRGRLVVVGAAGTIVRVPAPRHRDGPARRPGRADQGRERRGRNRLVARRPDVEQRRGRRGRRRRRADRPGRQGPGRAGAGRSPPHLQSRRLGHTHRARPHRARLAGPAPGRPAEAPEQLGRVLVTAALSGGVPGGPPVTFADVVGLEVVVGTARAGGRPVHFVVPPLGSERALLAVEIYRRRGRWRVGGGPGLAEGRAPRLGRAGRRAARTRRGRPTG